MVDRYLVYANGSYRSWTRQTRMRITVKTGEPLALTVVAVGSNGLRSAPSTPLVVTPP